MGIRCSVALLLLGVASCSGAAPAGPGNAEEVEGTPIKITIFRFMPDPKTNQPKPYYAVMLSRGWKMKYGSWAREPFERVHRSPFKGDQIPDERMKEYVAGLRDAGWDRLPATDLATLDVNQLYKLESDAKRNPVVASQSRWITVQVGDQRKSVSYAEVFPMGGATHESYQKCEKLVLGAAMGNTAQVTVENQPLVPK